MAHALHDTLTLARAGELRPARAVEPGGAPPRPGVWQERAASRLFQALSPRIRGPRRLVSPSRATAFEHFEIERSSAPGTLAATWYPASDAPRGAVLLAHPWIQWGQAYFHRRGRIEALQEAGYHAMTFDFSGFGGSSPAAAAFYDRDLDDAASDLARRAGGLPLHFWGVSCGGYWGHALASRAPVAGAMFEDVARHLIEWSERMAPWGRPCYALFRHGLSSAYRFMDLGRHAPYLRARAIAYASGGSDRGVRPGETRELARLAGAEVLIVPGADHLESIKRAGQKVIALALETFARAERRSTAA